MADNAQQESSYKRLLTKIKNLTETYNNSVPFSAFTAAFRRATASLENQPQIQNTRVKAISTMPADYSKEELGEMLRNPYGYESALRGISQGLKLTTYPYYKITKTYQDIPTYHYYTMPLYLTNEAAKTEEFRREFTLLDKINKRFTPDVFAHKVAGQAVTMGKVFYVLRYDVDKSHNEVKYIFPQQLPSDWCKIIGYNNVTGYTISFNMMYFLQPGTDWTQFGDLFEPYIEDFTNAITTPTDKNKKIIYASLNGNKTTTIQADKLKTNAKGDPEVFMQNGRWCYYVSLPAERVYTFEIDDTSPAVLPPLSGLMMTYGQQSDFEAIQLSLLTNPLVKIFTGSIPYFNDNGATKEDGFRLSLDGRTLFEYYFDLLMSNNNTSGTAFYSAPVTDIKSHDYRESANANDISATFNRYGMEKAGLAGLIPVEADVKAGQAELSAKLESRYCTCIYNTIERLMNNLYRSLNLRYDWQFKMFGSVYTDAETRKSAGEAIARGDISAHFILSALDGYSWLDKLSMMRTIKESGMLEMLIPPITSYTAKQDVSGLPPQSEEKGGRPQSEDISDSKEKSIDAGAGARNG